jgi:hypothetical protein
MWQHFLYQLIAWFLLFAGISTPVTSVPAPPPAVEVEVIPAQTIEPSLWDALSFAPPNTDLLGYTNWVAIKRQQSVESLTSAAPFEQRMELMRALNRTHAAAAAFAIAYFARQAEEWGWDSTDLLWEAAVQGRSAPVFVMRLRDDFDMARLDALFDARGFARSEQAGASVYTHRLDLTVSWRTELAVFNAAVLAEEHILIHSSDPIAISDVLAAHDGAANWQHNPAALAVASALSPTTAALVALGPQTCSGMGMAALLPSLLRDGQPTADELAAIGRDYFGGRPLDPYWAMGIGYHYYNMQPLGTIVLHYANAQTAQIDLQPRQQLAAEGKSIAAQAPISEALFTLEDARVEGSSIVLEVRPAGDLPRRLFDMFYRRDMPFAACS